MGPTEHKGEKGRLKSNHISCCIANVNDLYTPIKRKRLSECIKQKPKQNLTVCHLKKINFKYSDTDWVNVTCGK